MAVPFPQGVLVTEHVEVVCRSEAFGRTPKLPNLLRFIVKRTLDKSKITEGILARELWPADTIDKAKVRMAVGRLRTALKAYYKTSEARTEIILIDIPSGELDQNTRKFPHYSASISFRPAVLTSAETFARVLNAKYDLPLPAGERWFNEGVEPLHFLYRFLKNGENRTLIVWEYVQWAISRKKELPDE